MMMSRCALIDTTKAGASIGAARKCLHVVVLEGVIEGRIRVARVEEKVDVLLFLWGGESAGSSTVKIDERSKGWTRVKTIKM